MAVVLLDLDEVVFPFADAYHQWLLNNGHKGLSWEGLFKYDLDKALGSDNHDKLAEKFLTDLRTLDVNPIPGSVEGVKKLINLGGEIMFCSARFAINEGAATRTWVERYFPGYGKRVMLTRDKQLGSKIEKGDVAWMTGAAALVDDSYEHHIALPDSCKGVLMKRRDHLPSDSLLPNSKASFAENWDDVVSHIKAVLAHRV
ncbi:MAG: 5' nucleotidase, NT5C type [Candidatus Paceibacterota bacterium]